MNSAMFDFDNDFVTYNINFTTAGLSFNISTHINMEILSIFR